MLSHADGGGDDGTDCGLRVRLLGALGPCDLLICAASDREPGACTSVGSLVAATGGSLLLLARVGNL